MNRMDNILVAIKPITLRAVMSQLIGLTGVKTVVTEGDCSSLDSNSLEFYFKSLIYQTSKY
jgi:hypothetical protein